MRKIDVWKIGKKTIAAIVVFAMVFSVFVGIALNGSAVNADKGIKSTVDVIGAPAPIIDGELTDEVWDDAVNVSLTHGGTEEAKAYLTHDGVSLYIGFDIQIGVDTPDDYSNIDELHIYIDTEGDKGAAPQTDDIRLYTTRGTTSPNNADAGYWYTGTETAWHNEGTYTWGYDAAAGWTGKATFTSDAWYVEYKIDYTALGITANVADQTIGIGFYVKDQTGGKSCSWPEGIDYASTVPDTWGNASSPDDWFRAEVGWLDGYTVDETGSAVGDIPIWIYGGAEKYYNTVSNETTGYYNFNDTVPTGIPIEDYSLIAENETLISEETLFPTIEKDTTTNLNITLKARPPMEGTGVVTFKDEFSNLTGEWLGTLSIVLVGPDTNADGYVNDTEAGLKEDFFAGYFTEPAANEPMPDFSIDDTQYLYVNNTWNLTVDVPTGNVTKIVNVTWVMKYNYTSDVNVSKSEHIINMTIPFDNETDISSDSFVLPGEWRKGVDDYSTPNVTVTGWTTITVDPLMDQNLTDDITNETVSIRVIKDVTPPETIVNFVATAGLTNATLTWDAATEADFKHYLIYNSTEVINETTLPGLTPVAPVTDVTVTTYVIENLHGNWYFAVVAVDVLDNPSILNATGPKLINQAPVANFTISQATPHKNEVTFNASVAEDPDGDDIVNWTWNISGVIKYGLEVTHTFATIDTFNVILTVKDEYGEYSTPLTKQVTTENQAPVANFTISPAAPPYYTDAVITFNASDSTDPDDDTLNYTWNISGVIKYELEVTHTFTTVGTFNVTLTVKDIYDATNSKTLQVTTEIENQAPTLTNPAIDPTKGDVDTEFTFRVTYTDADGDAPNYVKVVIDNTSYNMSKVSGNYTTGAVYEYKTKLTAGAHTYKFTAADAEGLAATETASTEITVEEKPSGIADIWLYVAIIIIVIMIIVAVAAIVIKKKKKPEAVPETVPETEESETKE